MDRDFCKNLKKARLRAGFTQAQVAAIIGVAKNTYSNWETGVREPDLMKIKALAKALSVTCDYLIGLEKIPEEQNKFLKLQSKFGTERLIAYMDALEKVSES